MSADDTGAKNMSSFISAGFCQFASRNRKSAILSGIWMNFLVLICASRSVITLAPKMPPPIAPISAASVDSAGLAICERCGQAHAWQALAPGAVARCMRCDAVLGRGHRLDAQGLLALTLAAAVVFIIANTADLIDISLGSSRLHTTFPQAIAHAWAQGDVLIASLAILTALVAPALFIGLRLYLLAPLVVGRSAPGFAGCLRVLHAMSQWNTLEVLTVAALLALVRIAALADATPQAGLFALGALTLLMAGIESAGLHHLWRHAPQWP